MLNHDWFRNRGHAVGPPSNRKAKNFRATNQPRRLGFQTREWSHDKPDRSEACTRQNPKADCVTRQPAGQGHNGSERSEKYRQNPADPKPRADRDGTQLQTLDRGVLTECRFIHQAPLTPSSARDRIIPVGRLPAGLRAKSDFPTQLASSRSNTSFRPWPPPRERTPHHNRNTNATDPEQNTHKESEWVAKKNTKYRQSPNNDDPIVQKRCSVPEQRPQWTEHKKGLPGRAREVDKGYGERTKSSLDVEITVHRNLQKKYQCYTGGPPCQHNAAHQHGPVLKQLPNDTPMHSGSTNQECLDRVWQPGRPPEPSFQQRTSDNRCADQ